jgi:arginyl-tRNA synthetase
VTEPMTSTDVALHLAKLGRDLEGLVRAMDGAEREAVNRREDFTLAQSRAFLRADGAMDLRKHQAIVDSHAERLAAELAEATVRGMRRQLDSIKVRIDIGRSMGAAIRSEIALGQPGQA